MNYRESSCFNCFYHCCTATCTGASRTGQDNCVHSVCFQFLAEFSGKSLGGSNGCSVSNGGVEVFVELADLAFLFQVAQNVNRQYAVWNVIGVGRVISAVSGFPFTLLQAVKSGDVILAVLGSGG